MGKETTANLKSLMAETPDDAVVTTRFLRQKGFSYDQLVRYKNAGWLDELGQGAYCRHGHNPSLYAALSAVNQQLQLPVHVGGRSALDRSGFLHFLPFTETKLTLYANRGVTLPTWFRNRYNGRFSLSTTRFIPTGLGVDQVNENGFLLLQSDAERAILELMDQVPNGVKPNECFQMLELMNAIRPKLMSKLLTQCSSIKVKRLFLLLAEDASHAWYKRLDLSSVTLGTGCRMIDANGRFNAKYNLVVSPWREI